MVESDHMSDGESGLPVFSLYGETRRPTAGMFEHFDVLLVDLQEVGTRVYTFLSTLAYCLEGAAEHGRKVLVLDRPNPLGGAVIEGNLLSDECRSFVGLFPIPMRHGLTIGEAARLFNEYFGIGADLEIITMDGWERDMYFPDTGRIWLFPSPNMPHFNTALLYPGQVIWEGTNVSEGRGTCLPFEIFGAPWLNHQVLAENLPDWVLAGCVLRPVAFEPTSNKHSGSLCRGFQVQVTDRQAFSPYRLALATFQTIRKLYPDDFSYKQPPYEYEFEKLPMDLIIGSTAVRFRLEQGDDLADIEQSWDEELAEFERVRGEYLLY